ncbi:hypothetical protein CANARDRAFT_7115 [[Candida] arabinofermentans NRRL YB-2248]|uniref:HPt domain-containing protein n=1 Tax=[Candida] arabinofermentans NRRL YB-2248 TaxID=983967 RepID=A0A1E4T1W5_9ASCO|nr:hypothetical protein CANARDRAFT_7115 [[Candida] arabinofermentans NRRL YB-2248]
MVVTQETLEDSELINWTIFQELLMMDEDEEGFALSLVQTFVEQAIGIFKDIDTLLHAPIEEKTQDNLKKLSSMGHYLKGSAAALGLQKVQFECERLQNYGNMISFDDFEPATKAQTVEEWYACIEEVFSNVLESYSQSKQLLADFFNAEL